eukprot:1178852-Alexandrium_andersonii.AAC.1
MSASLVGSEMCIRDRLVHVRLNPSADFGTRTEAVNTELLPAGEAGPVSYTHLTLPTICSV